MLYVFRTVEELNRFDWSAFACAYGSAEDIPPLLKQLTDYPSSNHYSDEPYFTLWSSLCHQGDVYSGSYAAVPFIIDLAKSEPSRINHDYILLPVSIELARLQGNGPEIPKELSSAYTKAIESLPALCGGLAIDQINHTMAIACSAAIAIAGGHTILTAAILELEGNSAEEFLEWKVSL